MDAAKTIEVVIADDHEIIRDAITELLSQPGNRGEYQYNVVAYASNGLEALAQTKAHKPQILFLDVSMPFANGSEIVHDLKRWSPETRIIVFTGVVASGVLASLVEQGVDGLFSKGSSVNSMRDQIPLIVEGGRVVETSLMSVLKAHSQKERLTNREQQVLAKIVAGKSNKEIAAELFLSPKTVDKHRTSMMQKLDVHSVAQLMAKAIRDGLVIAE
ncbi:response regulator transcription factor [Congregibacter brevis]|uniref:Response regulator transcription factor n=1 Tax=Congregibacter brevis TaxID=3081201 RepID=A0ABZ0IG43_9GAMM|nr:response regulator transcription factor [Congregibacter sp. IMCC45268]